MKLFDNLERPNDHPVFRNLAKTELRQDIATWCEDAFQRSRLLLDDDFASRFRHETPQRMSELFFASAFLDAGWAPADRVLGFDLAFQLGKGRLLVEVTAPEPPSPTTWLEEKHGNFVCWSADEKTEDAALRRLTSAFYSKWQKIQKRLAAKEISTSDYIVIAISGIRLSAECPSVPDVSGPLPDFARAFLPVGSRYITVSLKEGAGLPTRGGWNFKDTIDQEGYKTVARDAFLRPDFQHIHAVAYTPMRLGCPMLPIQECAALHNPMAKFSGGLTRLGLGSEFGVEVADSSFSVYSL